MSEQVLAVYIVNVTDVLTNVTKVCWLFFWNYIEGYDKLGAKVGTEIL